MSNQEIVEMVVILILMSSEHFKEFATYVSKIEMQSGERDFMELALKIAGNKRHILSKDGAA